MGKLKFFYCLIKGKKNFLKNRDACPDIEEEEVRPGWSVQGRIERVSDEGIGGGWLQWSRGSRYAIAHRDHHSRYAHSECPRQQGTTNSRTHFRSAKAVQLPRWGRRTLRRKGCHPRFVRHRSGRVPSLQADRRSRRAPSVSWSPVPRAARWSFLESCVVKEPRL